MPQRCAVVGVGQTHHKKIRSDVSIAGLVREAAQRALEDAECTWSASMLSSSAKHPTASKGSFNPKLFLAEALRWGGKPDAAGCTRPAASVDQRSSLPPILIESGIHERVLTWRGRSIRRQRAVGPAGGRSGGSGAGGTFGLDARLHRGTPKAPEHIG